MTRTLIPSLLRFFLPLPPESTCRDQLGRLPFTVDINEKILIYVMYVLDKDEDFIVKQSLHISINVHSNGNE